ncbi:ChbG/HpnK family deacetylase [Nocardiopsis sp. NPDC007018]|uniref:ChbG/HpnK family deacetylase n=1 Tax=Nocardiopsis sp. NPDC007018 TaxID=3155721 RepID=UPI0033EB1CBF
MNRFTPGSGVNLIVQADDYGMCPPVTNGILRCFRAGVITQASVMYPAPDAPRALWLATQIGLPLGVHLTLMCEWEGLRWYPLTAAPSLRTDDGAFPPDLPSLKERATLEEAGEELRAQVLTVQAAGVRPTHMESHVRVFHEPLLESLREEFNLPCRDLSDHPEQARLDSVWHLSVQAPGERTTALLDHVSELKPGTHMVVAHPADDADLLSTLCPPRSRRWKWARDIRLGDSASLLDPRFLALCTNKGVNLTTSAALCPGSSACQVP